MNSLGEEVPPNERRTIFRGCSYCNGNRIVADVKRSPQIVTGAPVGRLGASLRPALTG